MKNARLVALKALLRVDLNEGYSNIIFNKEINKSELSPIDISFCGSLFYGVLEKKLTLDYIISNYSKMPIKKISTDILNILRMGLYQLIYMDKVPESAAVNESVNLAKSVKKRSASGFINGILRAFLKNGKKYLLPSDKLKSLSITYSCPEWIIKLFMSSYGEKNALKVLKSLDGRPPINVRVNNLKISPANLILELEKEKVVAKPVSGVENALTLESTGAIESLSCYKKGFFHVQDIASQICCRVLGVLPGQTVVDVCASPGGKSFTIAEMMKNTGKVFSFDLYETKVNLIKSGANRLGINIIEASVRDAANEDSSVLADRVLCDVPCSGLGIMRRKPEIRYKDDVLIDNLPKLQYNILCKSCNFLKIGGILVYSTCTLNPCENNDVATKFLAEHKSFEPVSLGFLGMTREINESDNQLTLLPGVHKTDGFFISAFRRVE